MGAIRVLAALAAILLFCNGRAMAEDYAAVQGYVHSFNNGVSVYSGVFALNKDVNLDTTVSFKYAIDLINPDGEGGDDEGGGAVAAVSGASAAANAGSDVRNDVLVGVSHNFNNVIGVEAYYDFSHEKDYTSHTPTITFKKDLFDKNTTLTFGYSRNMDTINGRFMTDEADRTTDNFFFGITQVLSPVTVAQVGYSHSKSDGQLSEGIRLVPTGTATDTDCSTLTAPDPNLLGAGNGCVNEAFPSERKRDAYLVGVNHYFTSGGFLDKSALRLSFRYYDDSWDISSWMGEAEFYKYLSEVLIMRLDYRYYTQSAAFFVKDTFTSTDQFKTVSPQLEDKDTHLVGLKFTYLLENPTDAWTIAVNSLEAKYEFYTESIGVNAHVVMGGLRLSF